MGKESIRDAVYAAFDEYMDAGWRAFVDVIRKENKASNARLFRIVGMIRSKAFTDELQAFHKRISPHCRIRVSRQPSGFCHSNAKCPGLGKIWLNQKSGEDGMTGEVYVQVKPHRWLRITY